MFYEQAPSFFEIIEHLEILEKEINALKIPDDENIDNVAEKGVNKFMDSFKDLAK